MNRDEIKNFINECEKRKTRTIIIIDYSNVDKWKDSLKWPIDIKLLASLTKHMCYGDKSLRRFYYGSDYGKKETSVLLTPWSRSVLETARNNKYEIVTKRVKYIHDPDNASGFSKKCDLDVEMAVDLIKFKDNYDTAIIFSGDGDLAYVMKYLKDTFGKKFYTFGARDHIGREIIDAKNNGDVIDILYAEDFEYRLNQRYQKRAYN